jgi:DNA topoisomerase-1
MNNRKPQNLLARKKQQILKKGDQLNVLNTPFLVIVESPSKCAKIEKYLGFQYKCIASKGHICSLKNTPSQKNNYVSEFEIIPEKKGVVDMLKSYVSQVKPENVFLATDDDREGEAIAWHICNVCNLSVDNTFRILFHEITPQAIQRAIKSPIHIRMGIVRAQQARQIIDRLIGFQISPMLTKMIIHDSKFLSAGRCQTPILKMIFDQYVDNQSKTAGMEYQIRGTFFSQPSTICATLNKNFETESQVLHFLELSKTYVHVDSERKRDFTSHSVQHEWFIAICEFSFAFFSNANDGVLSNSVSRRIYYLYENRQRFVCEFFFKSNEGIHHQ